MSTSDEPSMPGWLLEQIAVDEARASAHHRVLCMRIACDNDGCVWGADEQEAMQRERVCTCGYPDQIRARCEAMRLIVEDFRSDYDKGTYTPDQKFVLRVLAAAYSDRPGYREEWRV